MHSREIAQLQLRRAEGKLSALEAEVINAPVSGFAGIAHPVAHFMPQRHTSLLGHSPGETDSGDATWLCGGGEEGDEGGPVVPIFPLKGPWGRSQVPRFPGS